MKKKSLKVDGRGRKMLDEKSRVEKELDRWLDEQFKNERRITRTMIFRKVMEIDPNFCGGVNDPELLNKLKRWFYYGAKLRCNLSVRKIASVGQKLPTDWEAQMVKVRERVRRMQKPALRGDGTVRIVGVKDEHLVNTDHVPMYGDMVGNYSWGRKDSGRRTVKTGGGEKSRFTCQLSCSKGGNKLTPFIIFKGEKWYCSFVSSIMALCLTLTFEFMSFARCSCKAWQKVRQLCINYTRDQGSPPRQTRQSIPPSKQVLHYCIQDGQFERRSHQLDSEESHLARFGSVCRWTV